MLLAAFLQLQLVSASRHGDQFHLDFHQLFAADRAALFVELVGILKQPFQNTVALFDADLFGAVLQNGAAPTQLNRLQIRLKLQQGLTGPHTLTNFDRYVADHTADRYAQS